MADLKSTIVNGKLRVTSDANVSGNLEGATISEGGTQLSNKYLGKTATAADSSKLGGTAASSYVLTTDSRLSDARTPTSHTHGNIQNGGTITSATVTTASGVLVYDSNNAIQRATAAQTRTIIGAGTSNLTIGTTSTTAAAGNHTHSLTSETTSATGTVEYIKKVSFTGGVLTLQTAYLKVNSNS